MKLSIEQKNMLATRKLSYSALKAFGKSPRHYVQYCLFPKESTPAMVIGSAFDCLLLTPKDFKSKFMVMPEFKKKELKTNPTIAEQKEKFLAKNPGVTIMKQDSINVVKRMVEELMENEVASVYAKMKGEVQKHVYWSDKHTGLKFHGFIDKLCPELTLEVKKVADGSKEAFMRDAVKFGYPLQAACYSLATKRLFDDEYPFMYLTMGFPVDVDRLARCRVRVPPAPMAGLDGGLGAVRFPSCCSCSV